ncbi:Bro-N domain-containing protein [Pseudomonas cichorii]|uniref:Bro-N domain-containing protein n=1 Tax=Pseudomonas lijiangensis TaxID=2995658 RepID=A0ABX8HV44_9PSED|nr:MULTISPECIES: Bro-N domain-containing protein [Pseudomonas syringae group]MBX8498840.1 Bro-N domain-containing protein [Pseudomonas lijiangensis]MBX8504291.1 Bro-N domain-containing protein [Pseudomonas lijiangensis]MBX8508764.1 Bro-N domain-containing protein [Pseudomonas cichorii]MBX8520444.1 Bro-N domain-containing protein [Pseudomonas cichorii]MBX8523576.1 Bro-N domain-containing protein [Pseudomonas cichorii]
MQKLLSDSPCTSSFQATLFLRHSRMLRAIFTESQAWFCLSDLARLMGQTLGERSALKLDADQRRVVWLQANGKWQKQLMVSESGAFALLVHHYVPENRALRQWLTHEVLPVLHGAQNVTLDNPRLSHLHWPGTSLSVMQWRDEQWIRLRDMPSVAPEVLPLPERGFWRKVMGR